MAFRVHLNNTYIAGTASGIHHNVVVLLVWQLCTVRRHLYALLAFARLFSVPVIIGIIIDLTVICVCSDYIGTDLAACLLNDIAVFYRDGRCEHFFFFLFERVRVSVLFLDFLALKVL